MRWFVLLVLSACATHDVLRAEPIVARAVCSGGLAVFGYDQDATTCETEVESLGDGCYVAVRSDERPKRARQLIKVDGELVLWAPRLVECAPNEVDGHIMCVEDELPQRDQVFGEDLARVTRSTRLPYQYGVAAVTAGRCRERFYTWELAHVEAPNAPELVTTYWKIHPPGTGDVGERVEITPLRFRVDEDAIALGRILGGWQEVSASVCPGRSEPRVTIERALPSRIAQRFASVFARAVIQGELELPACARVSFGFTVRHPPPFSRDWLFISSRPLPLPRS